MAPPAGLTLRPNLADKTAAAFKAPIDTLAAPPLFR